MEDCLVYFFTGWIDSGKTTVIGEWASNEAFRGRKIVILATEDGDVEYDDINFPDGTPVIIEKETAEVNRDLMFRIEAEHKPDVIFIEWNGSVSPGKFFDEVDVPERWALAAYFGSRNQRRILSDHRWRASLAGVQAARHEDGANPPEGSE